jgi:radical SAM superfamily enzyme YgiQ (UPF0313 family)
MFAEFVLEGLGRVGLHEKAEALSLTVEGGTVLTFDRAGRTYAAFLEGHNYRRGLDNRVLEKWGEVRAGRKVRRRRWLTPEETERFLARLHGLVQAIDRELGRGPREVVRDEAPSLAEWRAWLAAILRYDGARLEEERQRYREIYHSVSILPPDQYRAVVVQATEGCHWNRCTFCDLYRDRPFRIRPADEFRAHVREVKAFLGAGLELRKSVFLGDANALIIAQPQLRDLFKVLEEEFAFRPEGLTGPERAAWQSEHPGGVEGIYSFIDAFSPQRKSGEDFAELRERGLRRVYVGLETGHAPLLRWLNKPGHPDDMAEWVVRLKEAGLQVGVILLVGAGGEAFATGHVADSVALVRRLPLDEKDLIYLSEFIDPPHGEYARRMAAANVAALSPDQLQAQQEELRSGLRPPGRQGPKITTYDLREFVY